MTVKLKTVKYRIGLLLSSRRGCVAEFPANNSLQSSMEVGFLALYALRMPYGVPIRTVREKGTINMAMVKGPKDAADYDASNMMNLLVSSSPFPSLFFLFFCLSPHIKVIVFFDGHVPVLIHPCR